MKRSTLVRITCIVCVAWAIGGVSVGCSGASAQRREDAVLDLLTEDAKCALQNLNRTPEQMLLDCAVPTDTKRAKDVITLFTGAQAGAMKAGARLPAAADAGPK